MARGVDPSSGNMAAIQGALGVRTAAAKAAAGNVAATQVETIGQARKMDAANLGRGLASNQATSAGLALTAGNNSSSNMAATGGINGQGAALMNAGYSGAQSGLAGAASSHGSISALQQKANDSGNAAWGAMGNMVGQVGAAYAGSPVGSAAIFGASDETIKKDIEPVDADEVLQAVEKIPVESWAYRRGAVATDDGERHIGPMAQNVAAQLGANIAPDGKKIDLVSMNGILMSSVQALSKKVNRVIASQGIKLN